MRGSFTENPCFVTGCKQHTHTHTSTHTSRTANTLHAPSPYTSVSPYTHIQNYVIKSSSYQDIVILVSWCGGELWVDQRKKCADICDVAQVTDISTLPN